MEKPAPLCDHHQWWQSCDRFDESELQSLVSNNHNPHRISPSRLPTERSADTIVGLSGSWRGSQAREWADLGGRLSDRQRNDVLRHAGAINLAQSDATSQHLPEGS